MRVTNGITISSAKTIQSMRGE